MSDFEIANICLYLALLLIVPIAYKAGKDAGRMAAEREYRIRKFERSWGRAAAERVFGKEASKGSRQNVVRGEFRK